MDYREGHRSKSSTSERALHVPMSTRDVARTPALATQSPKGVGDDQDIRRQHTSGVNDKYGCDRLGCLTNRRISQTNQISDCAVTRVASNRIARLQHNGARRNR